MTFKVIPRSAWAIARGQKSCRTFRLLHTFILVDVLRRLTNFLLMCGKKEVILLDFSHIVSRFNAKQHISKDPSIFWRVEYVHKSDKKGAKSDWLHILL